MVARHRPVLLQEVVELLVPERGGLFVDCTVGLGGHAEALLEAHEAVSLIGIDRDPQALELAATRLRPFGGRVRLLYGSFDQLAELLTGAGVGNIDGLLADLGVSSMQLERAERGFSFRLPGPLDMRMDPAIELTAAEIVNRYSEGELERIFREYGEERQARRVARAIVESRSKQEIETTSRLRDEVHRALRRSRVGSHRTGKIDAATRVFQALRIEVNQELAGLRQFLDQSLELLESDGRLVVISYHSLEDRIVKTALREAARGDVDPVTGRRLAETQLIEILTRKPTRPTPAEVALNPRSRSARLRAARRL